MTPQKGKEEDAIRLGVIRTERRQMLQLLRTLNFVLHREGRSHTVFIHPNASPATKNEVEVPRHGSLAYPTARAIQLDALTIHAAASKST